MKLQYNSVQFNADNSLVDFIQKKVDKLEKFYDRWMDGEVYLRIDKHESHNNKIVEIKLHIPGQSIFAKAQNDSFEVATLEVTESLRRQILKLKDKKRH